MTHSTPQRRLSSLAFAMLAPGMSWQRPVRQKVRLMSRKAASLRQRRTLATCSHPSANVRACAERTVKRCGSEGWPLRAEANRNFNGLRILSARGHR